MTAAQSVESLNVVIGGTGIEVTSVDEAFLRMLHRQYQEFIGPRSTGSIQLAVDLVPDSESPDADEDIEVRMAEGLWNITRGDFAARYDPARRRGTVRQNANRHSLDSVIRILHTLTLAPEGGFLVHSASAIRNGKAFLFAGRSGAGKTTLSRYAPDDACLLSDEVSYVGRSGDGFLAWGTPFTGELGTPGANRSAPVKALCFLQQAKENRMVAVGEKEALRQLLANVLFFANDPDLVRQVFDSTCEFVSSVETFRLDFAPGERVWDLIQ
jgi:hypothetical protein